MGTAPVQALKNGSTNHKENDYGYSKGIELAINSTGEDINTYYDWVPSILLKFFSLLQTLQRA